MQISHPSAYWNGIKPEDVFLITDDLGAPAGTGFVVYQYLPSLYPDRPVNIYFQAEGSESGRSMLFGALVARARQLRDIRRDDPARIYTCVTPADQAAMDFYRTGGMSCEEREVLMELTIPNATVNIPMGCALEPTPLYTQQEQLALLDRLRRNDINHIDPTFLVQLMRTDHFHTMGMFSSNQLVGEAVIAGSGSQAELVAVYVENAFRRQGLGTALCRWILWAASSEGVTRAAARIVTRSLPQKALARHMGGKELETTAIFPQIFM
jgi:GNAT superfamily N-acetyltransferase